MSLLIWGEMYKIGIQEIDMQHHRLFDLANELADAVLQGSGEGKLLKVYAGLIQYTTTHFSAEEALMAHHRYPQLEGHKQQHRELTQRVHACRQHLTEGDKERVDEAMRLFTDWLSQHIMSSDKEFAQYAKRR